LDFQKMTVILPPGGTAIVRAAFDAIIRECDGSTATRPVADGVALVLLAADYLAGFPAPFLKISDLPSIMATPSIPRSVSHDLCDEALSLYLYRVVEQAERDPIAFLSPDTINKALDADPLLKAEHERREMQQTIQRLQAEVEALRGSASIPAPPCLGDD
jgi:uncharacterized protein (DUF58 family)